MGFIDRVLYGGLILIYPKPYSMYFTIESQAVGQQIALASQSSVDGELHQVPLPPVHRCGRCCQPSFAGSAKIATALSRRVQGLFAAPARIFMSCCNYLCSLQEALRSPLIPSAWNLCQLRASCGTWFLRCLAVPYSAVQHRQGRS